MPQEARDEYRKAYDTWMKHVQDLHRVLLDGERMPPPQLKGLLNREARSKEQYDAARRRLLGLSD
jgi:hypothetical protein